MSKDYSSVIPLDMLVVPENGVLVLTMPPDTSDKVIEETQKQARRFFADKKKYL